MPDLHRFLSIYLNDHLTGATAGRDLFRRVARSHRGTPRGTELVALAHEVDQDRNALVDIMRDLDIRPSPLRVAAAQLGERVGRFKPNGMLLRRSPLSDVVELEAMRVAVAGKAAGWEALLALAAHEPRLRVDRLRGLIDRAHDQAGRVSRLHQRAVEELAPRALGL